MTVRSAADQHWRVYLETSPPFVVWCGLLWTWPAGVPRCRSHTETPHTPCSSPSPLCCRRSSCKPGEELSRKSVFGYPLDEQLYGDHEVRTNLTGFLHRAAGHLSRVLYKEIVQYVHFPAFLSAHGASNRILWRKTKNLDDEIHSNVNLNPFKKISKSIRCICVVKTSFIYSTVKATSCCFYQISN